jgi:hypothetical protein
MRHAESCLDHRLRRLAVMCTLAGAAACSDGGEVLTPPPQQEPPPAPNGQQLFDSETFGGNRRTCLTCHTKENGTITLEDVARRLAADMDDELFLHDALDDGTAGTSRLAAHATIRVEIPLPPGVTLAANPAQRSIIVNRGIPTTLNAPALDGRGVIALMLDLRDGTLEQQARGAIRGHALGTVEPTNAQLAALAHFQQSDARFFSSAALRAFVDGGPAPELPTANNESEARGRLFFVDTAMTAGSKAGSCALCHSGPALNEANQFGRAAGATGARGQKFGRVHVAETNVLGNPTFTFLVDGPGGVRTVTLADPGIMLTPRSASQQLGAFTPPDVHPADLAGFFKTPSLWAVGRTAPYFHDNSAKTLRQVVDHYADVFFVQQQIAGGFVVLTDQDREDILAFLQRF